MARERTVIERQVDHLIRLVDDLLDVSRITRSKVELKRERIRVLVVDDNTDAAGFLADSVRVMGYAAEVAYDGPTALRVPADFRPDVAFLDIGLPVMDGYELAQHLRRLRGLASIALIAVTGYGQLSDRKRAEEAGFVQHLVKPVHLRDLASVLAGHAAQNSLHE